MPDLSAIVWVQDANGAFPGLVPLPFGISQAGSNKRYVEGELLVGTSDTTIPLTALGGGTLGYSMFLALEGPGIDLKTVASGTIFTRLDVPGPAQFFKFGSGVTAPVAISATASRMRFRIYEA